MPVHVPISHHIDQRADQIAAQGEGAADDLLSTAEAAAWLTVSAAWLEIARHAGYGPKFCRLGPRRIRYRRSDVLAWLEERLHHSTKEYASARPNGRKPGSRVVLVDGKRVVIPPAEAKPVPAWPRAQLRRRAASEPAAMTD
jgi:predicted DNA-binding transcriptional regulator AlpA